MQDVESAVAADRFGEGRFDLRAFAHVARDEMGVTAEVFAARAGGLRGGSTARLVDLGNDDLGALFGKAFGGGAADAAAPAGDECHFARQARHAAQG